MAKLEVYQLIDENDKEVAEVGSVHHGDRSGWYFSRIKGIHNTNVIKHLTTMFIRHSFTYF